MPPCRCARTRHSGLHGAVFRFRRPILFSALPAWLRTRIAFAILGDALAIDFGQMSKLGGVLNERGDILLDGEVFFLANTTITR